MTDRRTPHIAAIDGLRAIAVVAVMLFHVRPAWLPGGYVGVDIFFVISGFVVTGSIIDRRFTSIGGLLAFFYARRLLRIMPALVVMLLVTALLSDMFIPDAWLSQSASGVGKAAFLGISNIKLAMGDNEYFSPAAAFDPFLHTWSLGVEEQFYLIFPLIMYWRQRRISGGQHERPTLLVIAALSLLSLGLCAWLTGASWRYAFYSLPSRFWELGLGMSLRLSAPAWTPRLSHTSSLRATLLTTAVAAVMLWSFATAETRPFPFPLALLPAGGTAMALALVWGRPAGLLSTALSGRAMAYLGLRSYSLYLWHWPVIVLLRWTIGIERPWQMALALALALTMAIGSLSYRFIELPTHRNPFVLRQRPGHVVAGALFALGLSTAAGLALFAAKPALSLSDTAQTSLWYADERKPLWIGDAACDTRSSKATLDRGEVTTWSPSGCGTAVRHGRIFVVGDSHSLVYFPAFRQFAAQTGTIVRSYYATGCGLFRLDSPMSDHPECAAYYRGVIDQLRAEARPGDILFLPSLRLDRLGDQWGREEEASTQAGPGPFCVHRAAPRADRGR